MKLQAVLIAALLTMVVQTALGQQQTSPQAVLQRHGIEPTAAGVSAFLAQLNPANQSQQHIRGLVAALASSDYAQADAAAQALIYLPLRPDAYLEEALRSPDVELRQLAAHVVRRSKGDSPQTVLHGVVRAIGELPILGAAPALLETERWIVDPSTRSLLPKAMIATSQPGDLPLFEAIMRDETDPRHPLVLEAAAMHVDLQTADIVRAAIAKAVPHLRLDACRTLLLRGDRQSLPLLADLLQSSDVKHVHEALFILQSVSGEKIAFSALDSAEQLTGVVEHWQKWIANHASDAAPVSPPLAKQTSSNFITVCVPLENRVLMLDFNGNLVSQLTDIVGPEDCERLPWGNWLVACYKGHHLAEYTADSQRLWEWGLVKFPNFKGPSRVHRLESGNFLVAYTDTMHVAELNPQGEIVWQIEQTGWPVDAERLPGGNTLVAFKDTGMLWEYQTSSSRVIWRKDGLKAGWPNSAHRLANGNTLVTLNRGNSVVEFSANGPIVWQRDNIPAPQDAHRLRNGSTVVSGSTGVHMLDTSGNILWHYAVSGAKNMRVYE